MLVSKGNILYAVARIKGKLVWRKANCVDLAIDFIKKHRPARTFRNNLLAGARAFLRGGEEAIFDSTLSSSTINNRICALAKIGIKITRRRLPQTALIPRFHKRSDILALLRCLPHSIKDYYIMLALVGCRPIELVRLEWDRVDFDRSRFWSISKKGKDGRDKVVWYALPKPALAILRRRRVMFPNKPFSSDKFNTFRKYRKANKLTHIRRYDLRHNFATTLLAKTHNLRLVSQALNHSSVVTTQRYAFALPEAVSSAAIAFRV